jgi:hypothetical protein
MAHLAVGGILEEQSVSNHAVARPNAGENLLVTGWDHVATTNLHAPEYVGAFGEIDPVAVVEVNDG